MRPDLEAVGAEFSGRVRQLSMNVLDEAEAVRTLGIKGTPTIIGFVDGRERFRVVGRRSRAELRRLFESIDTGLPPGPVGASRALLSVAAGGVLAGSGLLLGPAWPLVAIGLATVGYGVSPLLRRTR